MLSHAIMPLQSAQFREYAMENSAGVALVLLCSSAIALLYNVVHAAMIKRTSAVTVTVLGEVKVVGLLILSAILLGKTHSMVHLGSRQVKSPQPVASIQLT